LQLTTKEEINSVSHRLAIFDGKIKKPIEEALLKPVPRMEQHRLFYLLLDDRTYFPFQHALEVLKKYGDEGYINKAIRQVQKSEDPIQYNANVAEIVAATYYIEKFKYKKGKVVWERKIPATKRSVDITLNGYSKPINIEVTGLTEMKQIRDFYTDHFKFRSKLKQLVADIKNPKYMYMVTFPDIGFVDVNSTGTFRNFIEKHTEAFADFIKEERKQGSGEFTFTAKDGSRARVKVIPLNKLKREYVELAFGWSGQIKDALRIKTKVIDKAKKQLPPDEYNFVYIANLAMLDDDDYIEAMYGQLQVVGIGSTLQPSNHSTQYADNGISKAIDEQGLYQVKSLPKRSAVKLKLPRIFESGVIVSLCLPI
jgi:hypothetical protein